MRKVRVNWVKCAKCVKSAQKVIKSAQKVRKKCVYTARAMSKCEQSTKCLDWVKCAKCVKSAQKVRKKCVKNASIQYAQCQSANSAQSA